MIRFNKVIIGSIESYKADQIVDNIDDFLDLMEVKEVGKAKEADLHRKVALYVALTIDARSPLNKAYPHNLIEREKAALRICGVQFQDPGTDIPCQFDLRLSSYFKVGISSYLRMMQMWYIKYTCNYEMATFIAERHALLKIFEAKQMDIVSSSNSDANVILKEQIDALEKLNKLDSTLPLKRMREVELIMRGSEDVNSVVPSLTSEAWNEVVTTSDVLENAPSVKNKPWMMTEKVTL